MKKTFFLAIFLISLASFARHDIPRPPVPSSEAWIKLTCIGVVSPRFQDISAVERQIMIGHVRFNSSGNYQYFDDLRDNNSGFFQNFTKVCTERRRDRVELGSFTGTWLDWGTDWGYTRHEMSQEFISAANSVKCRHVGHPCVQNSQCCGFAIGKATCNVTANTCESVNYSE